MFTHLITGAHYTEQRFLFVFGMKRSLDRRRCRCYRELTGLQVILNWRRRGINLHSIFHELSLGRKGLRCRWLVLESRVSTSETRIACSPWVHDSMILQLRNVLARLKWRVYSTLWWASAVSRTLPSLHFDPESIVCKQVDWYSTLNHLWLIIVCHSPCYESEVRVIVFLTRVFAGANFYCTATLCNNWANFLGYLLCWMVQSFWTTDRIQLSTVTRTPLMMMMKSAFVYHYM